MEDELALRTDRMVQRLEQEAAPLAEAIAGFDQPERLHPSLHRLASRAVAKRLEVSEDEAAHVVDRLRSSAGDL